MEKIKIKVAISIVLVVLSALLAVAMVPSTSSASTNGIIIDFGDRDIAYVSVDVNSYSDAMSALEYACSYSGFELVVETSSVISIDSLPSSGSVATWALYVTTVGSTEWTKITGDPADIQVDGYSAVAWGLCLDGELPTTAVDATGYCYYSYGQATRVVSLAPSCTETICADGGLNLIVGTDQYSNYPSAVVEGQENGTIAIVGGYTNPSYELIIEANPDLVICLANQSGHLTMADKLRAVGINVVVMYGGESIDTILDNTYIVGESMGYNLKTQTTVNELESGLQDINDVLSNYFQIEYPSVMVSLSASKSPWVAGSDTYISDILSYVYCTNSYSGESGWAMVNSETVVQYNPEYIIIVSSDYSDTEESYQAMLDSLSAEWKSTDAYKNGNIYLLTESATDLASRPSVRVAQLTELVARIMHPDAFDDDIVVPYYIGDDYVDYLTYTKDLGFN